jgi:hypothetical protein
LRNALECRFNHPAGRREVVILRRIIGNVSMKIAKSAHFHARFGGRPGWSGPVGIVT